MPARRLRISVSFLAMAMALAAILVGYLLRQQDDAFEAADWVAHSLDVRARLQQLLATIDDGPTQAPRALGMIAGLRERMLQQGRTTEALDQIAADLGFGQPSARDIVVALVSVESALLDERRQALERESRVARLALLAGSLVILSLLAAAFAIVIRDNRQRRTAEDELKRSNDILEARVGERTTELRQAESRQRELSRRLLQIQEEERRSLARELHDEVGQQLGAIKLNLKAMEASAGPANASRIHDGLEIVDATITRIRDRALDLRPALLDDLGLIAALEWLCAQQSRRSGIQIALDAGSLPHLPPELATALYRVVQEGITNALKHSAARNIDIALHSSDDCLRLAIIDNGSGFNRQTVALGVGLPGMRERVESLGGEFVIRSSAAQGTRIEANFAFPDNDTLQDQPAAR